MPSTGRERPNVILLVTDDQGYGDLSCHGNPTVETPHMDRLHAESARLEDFHVSPTCAPTRAALMTGRYDNRSGVWHTVQGRSLLDRAETTIADVFAASGYRTDTFGKWHLGDSYPYRPEDRGFEEVLVHGGGGSAQTPDYWGNDYFDGTYFRAGDPESAEGYCTGVWFDAAGTFIEDAAGEELYDIKADPGQDIKADPGQEHDVADEHPAVVDRLWATYEDWWDGVDPLRGVRPYPRRDGRRRPGGAHLPRL